MTEILYKDESFKIVGLIFEIYRTLGGGLKEKVYANALEELFKREKISYKREIYYPLKINDKVVGQNYFDFLVDDKIVVELKCGNVKYYQAFDQLKNYLTLSGLKLGLIVRFTLEKAIIKRIVNLS